MAKKTQQVTIGKEAQVRIIWNVASVDYTDEKKDAIREAFAKKYGLNVSKVKVEPNFMAGVSDDVISLNKDTIQNINDPKFHQQLYVQFLEDKKKNGEIEDYDIDEILKIDSQINATIDFSVYDKGKHYILKWLDWDNFLSFGESNHVDFTDFKGLILLNSIPDNQGGKSTFAYDILHFLFFGKTDSGKIKSLDRAFNRHLPEAKKLKVEGCIEIDGLNYIIRRTLTRSNYNGKNNVRPVTQKVEYFRQLDNGDLEELEDVDNLGEQTNVKTTQAIREAIGNERDFNLVISANSDNLKELISLKDTERGRLLNRWIGLLPLEDKDIKAREKWNKEINVNRYSTRYNSEVVKQEIEALEAQNVDNEKEIKKQEKIIAECEEKIKKENVTKDALLSSKKTIDDSLMKVDVHTLETEIQNLTTKGLSKVEERKRHEAEVEKMKDVKMVDEAVYSDLTQKLQKAVETITELKAKINNLKETNKKLAESEYCPTCKRKFENIDNSGIIKENEKVIAEDIQKGIKTNEEKKNIEAKIAKLNEDRKLYYEKNKHELAVSQCNVEIERLRNELKEKRNTKKEINANKSAIEENNKIDNALNIANTNIKTEENIRTSAKEAIVSFKKDIERNNSGITDRKVVLAKIEEEQKIEKNWKLYLMLVGKDGVCKMVLRNTLPIINNELHRLLDDVCDFDVEVVMNEKNDVDFYLITKDDGVRQELCAGSGFEQTAAALALRVVLGNMSALSKPPFLVLDEVLGGVAKINYDNMRKLYDKISQYYKFILQITHLTEIADWHDRTITIVKKNHVSRVDA